MSRIPHISEPLIDAESASSFKVNDNWFRYLEGLNVFNTWTPVLTFATPGDLAVAYSAQSGYYIKVGRLVVTFFELLTSSFTHTTASGNLQITGFPFVNDGLIAVNADTRWGGITKASYTDVSAVMASGAQLITFQAYGSGQTPSNVTASDTPTGGTPGFRSTLLYLSNK